MYLPLITNYDRVLIDWLNKLPFSPSNDICKSLHKMLNGMRNDGDLIELDLFHTIGGLETDTQRLTPLISTANVAFVVSGTVTLDNTGITASSNADYINLGWDVANDSKRWQPNSASFGTYCRTNSAATVSNMGTANDFDSTRRAGDLFYWRINDTGSSNVANTSSLGLSHVRRTGQTATEVYMNSVSKGTGTTLQTGSDSTDFTLCRHSGASSSTRNLSLCFAGSGLINPTTFYNRIQTYMTERGINV